ncbi:putative antitoxin, contains HTH domain [Methanophagales archaeon]|nr:putative antitoxin, contains HTH domain [Methanophagales archaeon]
MNISLSDKHRRNLEEIAKEEKVRTADAIRAIFELGLKEWELRKALRLYREGKTTLWKAAEIAELTLHELIDIIDREGIPYDYDVDATLDYVPFTMN